MICSRCGTNNADQAQHCVQCGAPLAFAPQGGIPQQPQYGAPQANIPDYLWQSIVVTLLCCLPLGIIGIIKSQEVKKALALGDIAGAQKASNTAKTCCMIGAGVGLFFVVIYIILVVIGIANR